MRDGVDALQTRGILRVETIRYGCIVRLCGNMFCCGRFRLFEDVLVLEDDGLECSFGWMSDTVCFLRMMRSQAGAVGDTYTPEYRV